LQVLLWCHRWNQAITLIELVSAMNVNRAKRHTN
jgi:hypothetical protein